MFLKTSIHPWASTLGTNAWGPATGSRTSSAQAKCALAAQLAQLVAILVAMLEGTMLTVESMGKTLFFVGRKHIVFEMPNLEFPSSPRVQSMIDSDRYGWTGETWGFKKGCVIERGMPTKTLAEANLGQRWYRNDGPATMVVRFKKEGNYYGGLWLVSQYRKIQAKHFPNRFSLTLIQVGSLVRFTLRILSDLT